MSYISDKIAPLLDRITDPIVDRLRKAPLGVLITVLCLIGTAGLAIYNPGFVGSTLNLLTSVTSKAFYMKRVAFDNSRHAIPLSHDVIEKTKSTEKIIASTLDLDLSDMAKGKGSLTAWSAAQAISSLEHFSPRNASKYNKAFLDFIQSTVILDCACWAETPDRKADFHNPFVSGWIFHALADMGEPAKEDVLDKLLSEQHNEGWWSTFPANTDTQYASTYATAWALLGLASQIKNGCISEPKNAAVEEALTRGSQWLMSVGSDARWSNYPYLTNESEVSESISGLVLHVLNETIGDVSTVRELNQQWLEALPERVFSVKDSENYYVEMKTPSAMAVDHFEQLKMPWMLVATVDAFHSGSITQRAKALRWLEHTLNEKSVSSSIARRDWWRAEVLYSLDYAIEKNNDQDGQQNRCSR
jgi:hypothetical protein